VLSWRAFGHYACAEWQVEENVANREQRGNKEKKKPKQDKDKKEKGSPVPFVQPELVRKPHKSKEQGQGSF
jgi:hypothetical protein